MSFSRDCLINKPISLSRLASRKERARKPQHNQEKSLLPKPAQQQQQFVIQAKSVAPISHIKAWVSSLSSSFSSFLLLHSQLSWSFILRAVRRSRTVSPVLPCTTEVLGFGRLAKFLIHPLLRKIAFFSVLSALCSGMKIAGGGWLSVVMLRMLVGGWDLCSQPLEGRGRTWTVFRSFEYHSMGIIN